jgi:hypothetical protein
MDDLIRRSDALAAFAESTSAMPEKQGRRRIEEIPAVDAVEVRHSHWEDVEVEDVGELTPLYVQSIASMRCASCNRYHNEVYHYGNPTEMALYCPYCGARMDGAQRGR